MILNRYWGFMILKVKSYLVGLSKTEIYVNATIKNQYCVLWKKFRKDYLVKGVRELEANCKDAKNKTKKIN